MIIPYASWIDEVRLALSAINMPLDEWQRCWRFDFEREYSAGVEPSAAAEKANRYWWRRQNEAINQSCPKQANCWLPRGHSGVCVPE
ncbi:MAG TPA: hypothetical protein VN622_00720 [Clostridia bacterium]|nr:hypothetical protein [Clostridia bacterium]